MENIFGIPANVLLLTLLSLSVLIIGIVAFSALRFPLAFRLGMRNIPRRKSQTLLIVSGLALSTLIVTSALGIGDTVDYSVKSGVYASLGNIDMQLGTSRLDSTAGFDFTGSPASTTSQDNWFDESIFSQIAALSDGKIIDAAAPALIQRIPVVSPVSNLSNASVEVRGIGNIIGDGLASPIGLSDLAVNEVLVNRAIVDALLVSVGDEIWLIKDYQDPTS